jgi:peptidoglycan/LPS O-acetylase OafA/YrhL
VLMVVIYHSWPGVVGGGYVGVDVFFVVSGFLITAHLVRELEADGRIRVFRFWARRARRLLPASLLVLVVSAVGVMIFVPRILWQQFLIEIGASALYVQNWLLAANSVDYSAASNNASPAQHFWSLSVEEQFYLVWPLLIIVAALIFRKSAVGVVRKSITVVLGVTTAASLVYCIWLTYTEPTVAYFVTPARAWEFGAGALLALFAANPIRERLAIRAGASWLGCALIVFAAFFYNGATPFPGVAAIVPVVGALLVIWAGAPEVRWAPTGIMSLRPVQYLGDISYSTYLWHFSLLIIAGYALGPQFGPARKFLLIIVTLFLAAWTTRYVENPVRRQAFLVHRKPGWTFAGTALAMAVVVCIAGLGWSSVQSETNTSRIALAKLTSSAPKCFGAAAMDPSNQPCSNPALKGVTVPSLVLAPNDIPQVACWSGDHDATLTTCHFGPTGSTSAPRVALVGDSHALGLLPAVMAIAKSGDWSVDTYIKLGCPWSTLERESSDKVFVKDCDVWRTSLQATLLREHYDFIVTTTYSHMTYVPVGSASIDDQKVAGVVAAWAPVARTGTKIVAIRDVPTFDQDPVACLTRAVENKSSPSVCSVTRTKAFGWPDPQIRAVQQVPNAALVDLTDLFCNATTCPAEIGSVVVYRDVGHMTKTYATTIAPYLYSRVSEALKSKK